MMLPINDSSKSMLLMIMMALNMLVVLLVIFGRKWYDAQLICWSLIADSVGIDNCMPLHYHDQWWFYKMNIHNNLFPPSFS